MLSEFYLSFDKICNGLFDELFFVLIFRLKIYPNIKVGICLIVPVSESLPYAFCSYEFIAKLLLISSVYIRSPQESSQANNFWVIG